MIIWWFDITYNILSTCFNGKLENVCEKNSCIRTFVDLEFVKACHEHVIIYIFFCFQCMIMMEMTDFTRGKGPLSTTLAVIEAAKKISEAGTKLDKLARQIADQCPESSTKKDLLAYLQRIALYCHQLNITSRVNN